MTRTEQLALADLRLACRSLSPHDDWDTALAELGALLVLAAERGATGEGWITLDGERPDAVAVTLQGAVPRGLEERGFAAGTWATTDALPIDGAAIRAAARRLRRAVGRTTAATATLLRIEVGPTAVLFVGPLAS